MRAPLSTAKNVIARWLSSDELRYGSDVRVYVSVVSLSIVRTRRRDVSASYSANST